MKIVVTANHVPFITGGAQYHIDNLTEQLQRHGHQVALLRFPFDAAAPASMESLMAHCAQSDLREMNFIEIDKVISLQFPGYGVEHPDHSVWIMHQHRTAYELYDPEHASSADKQLRDAVHQYDRRVLPRARRLFANSARVAERLHQYNGLVAEPLYHPPDGAEQFFSGDNLGYVFFPSRLESLKRQTLLIEAARHLKTPARILISGRGSQQAHYQQLIDRYHLQDRVRLLGHISEAEKLTLYANAMAVFFGPFDEDYGYITLEAMLSSRPVITCTDSGGPLEFVLDNETGFVVEPDARQIAEKIDWLYSHPRQAFEMGVAGCQHYQRQNISWDNVVEQLLGDST